ncbi:LamB/YcsF family protein [Ochrobactrum chromiisoli]|uniref:5-oxoprolinase subunit PxpA n=1 Tax=Ochrobactrum chromiisoli TaxID=2993941 RepID=A0ABT3QSF4_9HYPH|nr:5-oxoprolinase subunit PxpA [Ochrobactrum chromiisoli]MCX2698544.1 5-oxoprolinase subunit PxpA [Ochrobactrum chromiisoli]
MPTAIDLNSDLGESFGPWKMGDDAAMLELVSSANIACGGHAGDPTTMFETALIAKAKQVIIGAHPGFADREGFGRRLIRLTTSEVEQLIATQIGALMGAAALAGVPVRYVKPHGALGNWAADDRSVAIAITRATKAVSRELSVLAISGTELEFASKDAGLQTFSEIFADRGYLENGRLVPRSQEGAMIHDPEAAANRILDFLAEGKMPTIEGGKIDLVAHSICVHGDSPSALTMAKHIRCKLAAANIRTQSFLA